MNDTRQIYAGFVRLDSAMADDLSVVKSARVSFAKDATELGTAEEGLIKFLMRERHGTPFEHNAFRFHIKCPVFVAREWFRHRIGSFNEFSARYSEVPNEFHTPQRQDVRTQVGKPGSYTFEPVDDEIAGTTTSIIASQNEIAYQAYQAMLSMGVAKEVARMVLPTSMYTQFYWTVNARALMNFLSLRTDENAQFEIRMFADAVEEFFAEQMPLTCSAWRDFGKVCP